MMKDDIQQVLYSEEQLAEKVAELGARISEDAYRSTEIR